MRLSRLIPVSCTLAIVLCTGCKRMPGPPDDRNELMRPQDVVDFQRLYSKNCSACHGERGRNGPALDLSNPVYLGSADDASIKKWIVGGMPGTQMPAFGESAGGLLTDAQVDALVSGIRRNWAKNLAPETASAPSYSSEVPGDAVRGKQLYAVGCLPCHRQTKQVVTDP